MKNKKILCVLFFVILFCLLGFSKCFANIYYDTNVDDYKYHFIFSYDNNIFLITSLDDNVFVGANGNKLSDGYIFYFGSRNYKTYIYKDNNFVSCDFNNYSISFKNDRFIIANNDLFSMISSDFDIIYDSYWAQQLGEQYFFLKAPQGIVAQQVETVEMSQVFQEIVGVLPLIIVLLVSLVGLRKALKMLVIFLRQS